MSKIPYSTQYIDKKDIQSVIKVLNSKFLTQGPIISKFEKKLSDYCEVKYAVLFNSGTSALHAAYAVAGLKNNDKFITTPITFLATSNAGLYLGAKPVFVDIDIKTGNIDTDKIKKNIDKNTKLIVPVHYSGYPVEVEQIKKIADDYNLIVIEDAAHALGASYKDSKIGNCKYSHMTILSFHPVKSITTGEGGAVLTNDKNFYEQLLLFRSHGVNKSKFINQSDGPWYYEMQTLGYNYRMTDIQAALGLSQLKKLDKFINKRREIANIYNEKFIDNEYFDILIEKEYIKSSYHLYPILLKNKYKKYKKEIFNQLQKYNLGVQVHYIPVYLQPYYQKLGYKKGICPNAEEFYNREISIPIFQSMTKKQIHYVIDTIFKVFKSLKK